MLLYSSSVFVYGLYRINEKKKDWSSVIYQKVPL
jgi:hypothetical protein